MSKPSKENPTTEVIPEPEFEKRSRRVKLLPFELDVEVKSIVVWGVTRAVVSGMVSLNNNPLSKMFSFSSGMLPCEKIRETHKKNQNDCR